MAQQQPKQRKRFKRSLIFLSLISLMAFSVLSLSSCGKKGPLYLPDDPKHAPKKPQKL
ncbi:LPS translocon maturation chaperone LptM [Galenea microaerophila]